MNEGAFSILMIGLVAQTIRISVPYMLAAMGAAVSELGGVINIALEGLILTGAFCTVCGTYYSGSPYVGLIAAIAGGVFVSSIHAIVCIRFRANQIISGLAINILAMGLTKFFLKLIFHSSSNSSRIVDIPRIPLGKLASVPVVGDILSEPLILLTFAMIGVCYVMVYKTSFGLRLRAVGENPECADTLGIKVHRMRYSGVMISGVLSALAGAWLAFDQHQFTEGMSGGRGYIALTAMIFGKWNPLGAALASLLFGLAEALQIHLQTIGIRLPTQFIQMIPYVLTIIVLAGIIGRARAPTADGKPYPEE